MGVAHRQRNDARSLSVGRVEETVGLERLNVRYVVVYCLSAFDEHFCISTQILVIV